MKKQKQKLSKKPISINGFFPLYTTQKLANEVSPNRSSHIHMPKGLVT